MGEAVATQEPHVHSHTLHSLYNPFYRTSPDSLLRLRGESSPLTPPLRSTVCVCKLVQGCVSQPLRAQTSGWVCAL